MQTQQIRNQIASAISHEQKTGTLASLLRQLAQQRGVQPASSDIHNAVAFIGQYIEHAPALLEALHEAAQKEGVGASVSQILSTAEQYFLTPVDFIPDHLGLVGLMDDAYLAHMLVQRVSEQHQRDTGAPLLALPMDLAQVNLFIRGLIGEPMATQLDGAVQVTLSMPAIQQAMARLNSFSSPFTMGRDPVWGSASMDEVVTARLGSMGVVF